MKNAKRQIALEIFEEVCLCCKAVIEHVTYNLYVYFKILCV